MMKKLGLGLVSMVMLVCADGAVAQDFKVGDRIDFEDLIVAGDNKGPYTMKSCKIFYENTTYVSDGLFYKFAKGAKKDTFVFYSTSDCAKKIYEMKNFKFAVRGTYPKFISAVVVMTDSENHDEITVNIGKSNTERSDTFAMVTNVFTEKNDITTVLSWMSLTLSDILDLFGGYEEKKSD
ncbi:MAG: hypothetical protein KDD52_04700 [Bdellovibrionales bacterium]|nr:hypothetical protein [Bdellovibrionales bacterium]